jgi:phenylalanyl-tRNA synthetase beta chain
MKASYAWLKALLPGLTASPKEVGERLTMAGLEVEGVAEYAVASPRVVVAEVKKVERHPKAESLTLVTVDRGGGTQTVVCGAPNVPAPGGRVVLAPLGAELPVAGITVARREIRGVASEGMLCSENELGLVAGGGKGEGILILPADAAVGTPLANAIQGTHDFVIDVSVSPQRPDVLGHVGLARELAVLYGLDFAPTGADAPAKIAQGSEIGKLAKIEIADTERCPHYGAAVVVDVAVKPSPTWLRYRLESLGMRAISNLVDVTNLVLLEFGHPMHAFDLDLLPQGRVVVRRARAGETMVTLDGVTRKLVEDDLLITDGERPIALAGVMGGENTEVRPTTKRLLLECAYFSPRGIRRTARRHGLQTEASYRFERGVDPEGVPDVLAHCAGLMTRLGGGAAVPGVILAGVAAAPRRQVGLRKKRLVELTGVDIGLDRASRILERLGCDVTRREEELTATVPSWRVDLALEEDLVEEVLRVHGFHHVQAELKPQRIVAGRSVPTTFDRVRRAAAELGLAEALTWGFTSPSMLEALEAPPASVVLLSPLGEEKSVMRTSLLPGLLEALGRARRHGVRDVRLFTTGSRFLAPRAGEPLPEERASFAAVLAGSRKNGLGKGQPLDVWDVKGLATELVARVALREPTVEALTGADAPHLHPRGIGAVIVDGARVGTFGPLHPAIEQKLDLDGPALVVEIDLGALERAGRRLPQHRPLPVLPPVTRDLAFEVPEAVPAGELADAIRAEGTSLCESVELFDLYAGQGLKPGHRSLAFHLVFRDPRAATDPEHARTLTDEQVDALAQGIIGKMAMRFGASVRGG